MPIALSPGTTNARVDLRLSVLGEIQLHRALAGRIRLTSDFSPVFQKMHADFIDMEKTAFAQQGAYEGNPAWAPLSPKYAAWKARHFPGANILYRTGALLHALTGGAGHTSEIKPFYLRIAALLRVGRWDLGALHQTGTRHMPARKPLLLSRARRSRWLRFLSNHLRGETRGEFGVSDLRRR